MDLIPFTDEETNLLFGNVHSAVSGERIKRILSPLSNVDWNLDNKDETGLYAKRERK